MSNNILMCVELSMKVFTKPIKPSVLNNLNCFKKSISYQNKTDIDIKSFGKKIPIPIYRPAIGQQSESSLLSSAYDNKNQTNKDDQYAYMISAILMADSPPSFSDFKNRFGSYSLDIETFEKFCDRYSSEKISHQVKNYLLLFFHFTSKTPLIESDFLTSWAYLRHQPKSLNVAFKLMEDFLVTKENPLSLKTIQFIDKILKELSLIAKKMSKTEFVDQNGELIDIKIQYDKQFQWISDIKDIDNDFKAVFSKPQAIKINNSLKLMFMTKFPEKFTGSFEMKYFSNKLEINDKKLDRNQSLLIKSKHFKSIEEWDKKIIEEQSAEKNVNLKQPLKYQLTQLFQSLIKSGKKHLSVISQFAKN